MEVIGRKKYVYDFKGVCCSKVCFTLEAVRENGLVFIYVKDIEFTHGCPGNLSFISKVLNYHQAEWIIAMTNGHKCGKKQTSCMDQLGHAIEKALDDFIEVYDLKED